MTGVARSPNSLKAVLACLRFDDSSSAPFQNSGKQVFGGGLPDIAGDGNDRQIESSTPKSSEFIERYARISNDKTANALDHKIMLAQYS